jgi:hypothetical protein
MNALPNTRNLTQLCAVLLFILALCLVATEFLGGRKFLIFSVIASSLITFFWFLRCGVQTNSGVLSDYVMRTAITAAVIVSFLMIVGMGVFFVEEAGGMPPIAQTLLTSYTTVVGVVVAFYFGGSVYLEGKKVVSRPTVEENVSKPSA